MVPTAKNMGGVCREGERVGFWITDLVAAGTSVLKGCVVYCPFSSNPGFPCALSTSWGCLSLRWNTERSALTVTQFQPTCSKQGQLHARSESYFHVLLCQHCPQAACCCTAIYFEPSGLKFHPANTNTSGGFIILLQKISSGKKQRQPSKVEIGFVSHKNSNCLLPCSRQTRSFLVYVKDDAPFFERASICVRANMHMQTPAPAPFWH